MQFRGDRRGQAIQIGAVLLLGAIVLSFAIYQSTVVPEQNREIEFQHSQTVGGQLQDARNGIVSTGSTGDGRSVSVTLGTQYPSRVIAMNPAPPSGTLATVGTTDEAVNATIANAEATGETADFWNGTNRTYNTGALVYRPGYNEYSGAPTTWYENSVLFDEFRDANLTTTGQQLIDGTTISLVALNGSYRASRTGSVSLDFRGTSVSSRTVSVTNASADSNVTITVPTRLDEQNWEELLADEPHFVDARPASVAGADYHLMQIVLERGVTYDLRLSRVGLGTNVVKPEPAYLTRLAENTPTVPEGGKVDVTVEVRDRFDNPKRDVEVIAGTNESESSVSSKSLTSDGGGRVTVTYEAPDITGTPQQTKYVNLSLNTSLSSAVNGPGFNGSTPVNVSVPIRVDNSDGSGLGNESGGDGSLRAGQGGESTYSPSQSTELLTDENGVWSAISKTDQIIFSGGYPVVDPANGDEYVLSEFTIANASETFSIKMEANTTGGNYGGTVSIYSFAADDQRMSSLTPGAVEDVLTADRYNGTDVINRASYENTDATFLSYLRAIAEMDRSTTEVIFSDQDGRVNLTLQGESLFTAVMANSSTANDEDEFVRLYFENETDTGGWTISDTDDEASLPDERLQGEYYLTKNKTALLNADPDLDPAWVYNTSLRLADGGEALELRDAQGDLRDELAYGTEQTSHEWNLTLGEDEVANRTTYDDGVYVDTDTAGDWTIETIGNAPPTITGVTKPPDGNYTEGDVLSFNVSYDEAVVVSGTPAIILDIDGDGDNEPAAYQSGSNTQTLTFSYTIQSSDSDSDGIAFASTNMSGGTIEDEAENTAGRDFSGVAPDLSGITVLSYSVTIQEAQSAGPGNNIDVTFDVSTNDPNAQVRVQSLKNGAIREETEIIDVEDNQPQTETVGGKNQATDVRVILYGSNGTEQNRQTVTYNP
ncbi:hypothetical protein [Halapricum desulfuricans]|uniref:Putative surface protein, possible component of pili like system n=1 Tax=Halapricum desulfuricans TaxID=2841257 RepID=A0A897N2F4_9EURY|nr:hypothetical protein [Halapricum desulfuricans]QSG05493.1 putative surface protein, possible component of pili like system [Halapricum desulfuricans]